MPARLSDIVRVLKDYEVAVEKPSSGSHWKATKEGSPTYPIPAHNAGKSEIDDKYIKKLCANFGIDLDEFKQQL